MSINARGPRHGRGLFRAVSAGAVTALAAATLGAAAPAVAAEGGKAPAHRTTAQIPLSTRTAGSIVLGNRDADVERVDANLVKAKGPVDVMIELDAAPAATAFGLAHRRGASAAKRAAKAQTAAVKKQQSAVVRRLSARPTRATLIFRTHALYSGVAVHTDAGRLGDLAALPGVRAIHRLTPKQLQNSSSVPLIGAPAVWKAHDETGQGVRIGIIDTGIDYTHADLGGAGTVGAFNTAKASPTFAGTAKVVGGYDFAGDLYDPTEGVPATPDANPLDCNGHGSHVSGTTAGYGVLSNGSTYTGPYAADLDPADFRIGPGVAPGAQLYALRVFGCEGSTLLTTQALDWAADPDQDGDVSDHLDVVNMSLGSDYGSPADPEAVATNNLSKLGTVVVASMGNSGDVYEVGGSPGNASRALAVAASDDGHDIVDGLHVDSPTGLEPSGSADGVPDNTFGAMRSVAYDWGHGPGLTGTSVVTIGDWAADPSVGNNVDGCDPYTSGQAADIAHKVVLTSWDDGTGRRCDSAARAANAVTAGAAGIIYGSNSNSFTSGVTGSKVIPAMLLIKEGTDLIRARLSVPVRAAITPAGVTVTMTNGLRNSVTLRSPGHADQLAPFSSRGVGQAGNVKPDVAAPGVTTFSVAVGTGDEGLAESGTSMAAPHVTGEAALVLGAHSGYSVEEVKAAIMNTATQDVHVGPGHTGVVYGPERVGSGRVKVDAAVDTRTLAYDKDDPGAVSVSFGPMAVTADTSATKTVHIVNKRPTTTAAYTLAYRSAHVASGVTYTISPNQVNVPAMGSVDVKVTIKVVRSQLRRNGDPSSSSDPLDAGIDRVYRSAASGRVVLTPVAGTSGSPLRVPVWAAPRPASAMAAAAMAVVAGAGGVKTGPLTLSGLGVDQGTGKPGYLSTVSAFQLQGTSPRIVGCSSTVVLNCVAQPDDRSADLRWVGSASDAPFYRENGLDPLAADPAGDHSVPPATLSFGVTAWGPWRTSASYSEFDINLDTNADGAPDAVIYNTRMAAGTDDYDYLVADTVDLRPGPNRYKTIDRQLINLVDGSMDTGVFNTDSLTMSVTLAGLRTAGLISNTVQNVRYWVDSYTVEAGHVDSVGSGVAYRSVNWYSPGMGATGDSLSIISTDLPGQALRVRRDDATVAVDKPSGLFLIHHLNKDGMRAQSVRVKTKPVVWLRANDQDFGHGYRPYLTAKVSGRATGTVTLRDGARWLANGTLKNGWVTIRGPVLARGKHSLRATYNGSGAMVPSVSSALSIVVR